jgi:hypothetical protein
MANRFVKTSYDANTRVITWTFPGTQLDAVTLAIGNASAAVQAHAMVHGFVQTCSDPASGEKTAEGKRKAILARATFLGSGGADWTEKREGGVGSRFDSGAVIAAMARVLFAGDVDKANRAADNLAGKRGIGRDDALRLFAADARIASDMAAAKARATGINADELLAGMDAEEEEEGSLT